jgi:hypothetical protein
MAGLADLARGPRARHAQSGLRRRGAPDQATLVKAGGQALAQAVYGPKMRGGEAVLMRIRHRQTPLVLMRGLVDAGVTWKKGPLAATDECLRDRRARGTLDQNWPRPRAIAAAKASSGANSTTLIQRRRRTLPHPSVLLPNCPPHLELSPVRYFAHNDVTLRVNCNTMRVCEIATLVTRPPELREGLSCGPVQDMNHVIGAVGHIHKLLGRVWRKADPTRRANSIFRVFAVSGLTFDTNVPLEVAHLVENLNAIA